MDWNPNGPNVVELPEDVVAHDLGVWPVIQTVKQDLDASGKCPACRKPLNQMELVPKLLHGIPMAFRRSVGGIEVTKQRKLAARLRFKDGGVSGRVEIPGEVFPLEDVSGLPADVLITGVRVYYRPRDEVILAKGTKHSQRRHEDDQDPYERPRWEGPVAEFEIAGGMARAEAFLSKHNSELRADHARYSTHEAHADTPLEPVEG